MLDDDYKLYTYHKLDPIDVINCRQWVNENYDFYDGQTSVLWNKVVQDEFDRIASLRTIEVEETDMFDVQAY